MSRNTNKKNQLVVKDNALINASYNLDINEQRLILLAIVVARDVRQEITTTDRINILAERYAEQFGLTRQAAYMALKKVSEHLEGRRFSYTEVTAKGNLHRLRTGWVSEIGYVDAEARITLIFSPEVVRMITALEKHFTSYKLEQVSELTSIYAIRLYEILIAWRSTCKVPQISIDDLREKLGVEPHIYPRMTDFKRRVLDAALGQVNTHTDIKGAKYEQIKTGRTITGFIFTFGFNKQVIDAAEKPAEEETPEQKKTKEPKAMSAKQRNYYAGLLSEDGSFGSRFAKPAMSTYEFSQWINQELANSERLQQWAKWLSKAGYVESGKPKKQQAEAQPAEPKELQAEEAPDPQLANRGKPVSLKDLLEEAKLRDMPTK